MITIKTPFSYEEEIEKSKFIVSIFPLNTDEDAKNYIKEISKMHYKANHNCYSYLLSDGYQKSSDDGEPSGTGGLPILNAIRYSKVENVLVIVTRYFGGIKLGVGGLIRAYGGVTAQALTLAPKKVIKELPHYEITFDYSLVSVLEYALNKAQIKILKKEFSTFVTFTFYLEDPSFIQELINLTHNKIKIEEMGFKKVVFEN